MLDKTEVRLRRIVCGRFDDCITLDNAQSENLKKPVRIGSRPPSSLKPFNFVPIATNGSHILYNGVEYSVRGFLSSFPRRILERLIVLTTKENQLILDALVDFNLRIEVFEINYPLFDHVKYTSSTKNNLHELQQLLKKIGKLGIRTRNLAETFSTEHLYRVERALRFKNGYDRYFAFAYKAGYQEVFKLREERDNRLIIALDFNSMYAHCMEGDFVDPRFIRYRDLRQRRLCVDQLDAGLYRVLLKRPQPGFFKENHPFRYRFLNKSFLFRLEEGDEIEALLFKNEIEFYTKFFGDTEIIEGLCSDKTISHPLAQNARSLYEKRWWYKEQNNPLMHEFIKLKLQMMHSATNMRKHKNVFFSSTEELLEHLTQAYMIDFPENLSDEEKIDSIQDQKHFDIRRTREGFAVRLIDYNANELVYSLSSQIVANANTKMIETMERFLSHESVELCYANTDSLHISLHKDQVESFFSKHEDLISSKLGGLKVQAIASTGYWLDTGRYWLKRRSAVVLYRNKFFNHKGSTSEFTGKRKAYFVYRSGLINYVKSRYFRIENSFSYAKKIKEQSLLDTQDYERYSFAEVKNLDVAGDSHSREILKAKKLKADLYDRIATV